ncbi:MAG UNVERIFIED_CONTAM: hypothetical protein LVR18_48860 [Planctomycetaceae bacterium]|jgi:hypothetical protein
MSTIPGTIVGSGPGNAEDAGADQSVPDSALWSLFDAVPAWGVSVLVHVGIFLVLLTVTLPEIVIPEFNLSSVAEQEDVRVEEYVLDSTPTEEMGSMSNLNIQGASAAIAQSKGLDNHVEQIDRIEQDIVNPKIELYEAVTMPSEAQTLENIDLTGTTEHPGGTCRCRGSDDSGNRRLPSPATYSSGLALRRIHFSRIETRRDHCSFRKHLPPTGPDG